MPYTRSICTLFLILSIFFSATPIFGAEFFFDEQTIVRSQTSDDSYAFGGTMVLNAPIGGDLVMLGGTVRLEDSIKDDLSIAGGHVTVDGSIGDDVRFVGGTLIITGDVGGDVVAFAGRVEIAPDAHITGELHVFAGTILIQGRVDGRTAVQAGEISLSGRLGNDARLIAKDSIVVGEQAHIQGDLVYAAPDEIIAGTKVGTVTRIALSQSGTLSASNITAGVLGLFGAMAPIQIIALLLATFLLYWLMPRFSDDVAMRVFDRPIRSGAGGILFVCLGALGILLFVITIVGYLVGWVLFLVYLTILIIAFLLSPVLLGAVIGRVLGYSRDNAITPWTVGLGIVAFVVINTLAYVGVYIVVIMWMMTAGAMIELCWYKAQEMRKRT
ncbi:MAG: hypothetical protein Q8P93_03170 [bacterium]|nr:hypothetical protein [bacterium]